MAAPTVIRSTAGFRNLRLFELNANGYPIGSLVLEPYTTYTVSGSAISGSTVAVATGAAVTGTVGYYGMIHSGAKVLTINDPTPRVLPHIGDDGVFALQVLPPLESITGELRVDKTNDTIDAFVGNTKKTTVAESNLFGEGTNQRGFENQVGALAYSAALDTDPNSSTFGVTLWDFRIFPRANVFMRDTGYQAEVNERLYTFTPMFVTSHIWGTQFTTATEGYTRAQIIRGVGQYKPIIVSYLGDGSVKGFPFDAAKPAGTAAKIAVYKNGVLQTSGIATGTTGVSFAVAPALNDIITVYYETTG